MSITNSVRVLEENRRSYELHDDNVKILSRDVEMLNRSLRTLAQTEQNEVAKINTELERQRQTFRDGEKQTFQTLATKISEVRKQFNQEETKFRSLEAAYEKQRLDFERKREEFNRKQQAYQAEEQKFRDHEQSYSRTEQQTQKKETEQQNKIKAITDRARLERQKLERQLEQKQRELRAEQAKVENARRNITIFEREISKQQQTVANDNHAPARQLYKRL